MTRADPDELARNAAIDFARRLVPHWEEGSRVSCSARISSAAWPMPASAGAIATSTSRSSRWPDYPHRRSIGYVTRLSRCLPIGEPKFRYSGPTGTFYPADFRHWIA